MANGLRRFNRRLGGFPRFIAENFAIFAASVSISSLALALVGYALGVIPLDGHSFAELVLGSLLGPFLLLLGPGFVVAAALIVVVGLRRDGLARPLAVGLAATAGFLWLLILTLPQLLEGRMVTPLQLFAVAPWIVFGAVMRIRRG